MRKKHDITLKYPDVQASTATMNIHPHSACHYKQNSGSTPAGMNNLHTRGPAGRQTLGGSPATAAPTARQQPPSRMARQQLEGPRSRPLAGDENQPLKPKSRRPGAQVAPTTAATCPPTPHQRTAAAQSTPAGPHSRSRHKNENGTIPEHEYHPRSV
jgi:hypothetical protein